MQSSGKLREKKLGSGQVLRHKRGVQELHCGIGKVEKKGGGWWFSIAPHARRKISGKGAKKMPATLVRAGTFL